jgi:hypothetical protein
MSENAETTEDALARELEATRDDPGEWNDEPMEVRIRPQRSQVVSFRLPAEELDRLTQAVEQSGESLSEFVRTSIAMRIASREFAPLSWTGPIPSSLSFGGRNAGDTDSSYEIEAPPDTVALGR